MTSHLSFKWQMTNDLSFESFVISSHFPNTASNNNITMFPDNYQQHDASNASNASNNIPHHNYHQQSMSDNASPQFYSQHINQNLISFILIQILLLYHRVIQIFKISFSKFLLIWIIHQQTTYKLDLNNKSLVISCDELGKYFKPTFL